jgi:hypothetical protein
LVTLQELVDAMRENPQTRGRKNAYFYHNNSTIGWSLYSLPRLLQDLNKRTPTQACALGEAVLQLSRMAHTLLEESEQKIDYRNHFLAGTLAHCVSGTSIPFWKTVERKYSFTDRKMSRVNAILETARKYKMDVK